MQRVKAIFPIFLIFLFLSLVILFFIQSPLVRPLQFLTLPIQQWTYAAISPAAFQDMSSEEKLRVENNQLRSQLAQLKEIQRDNQAFRDQFQLADSTSQNLTAAYVVGMRDDTMMINKGSDEGIKGGEIIVLKNNVLGKISKVTPKISVVTLLSNPATSFTAASAKTSAIGVIKSFGGDSITMDNVVLSDKLEINDVVLTKGDIDTNGIGFPPKLVVGKIVSVNKKASSLFQQAKIKSLVDFSKVRVVFIVKN